MNGTQQWLQFFVQVSCFYREMYMLPLWKKYPNHLTNIWDSLAIFLEGYAFERQGRRPDYFHAAVDALFYCKQKTTGNMTKTVAKDVWQHFSQLLNNQNLNRKNNPLYPQQSPQQKCSVIEVILNSGVIRQNLTFTTYLQNQIKQNNNIQNTYGLVKSIRGIGDKVASFYLRDLVDVMNIAPNNVQNRHLLQPVDIWVERAVRILANNQGMNKDQVAKWIVNTSGQQVNPERVNMGIWFFCSNIVASEYRLCKALNTLNIAQQFVNEFRMRIKNICHNC